MNTVSDQVDALLELLRAPRNPYFRFPLPLLACAPTAIETLNCISAYCVREVGFKLLEPMGLPRTGEVPQSIFDLFEVLYMLYHREPGVAGRENWDQLEVVHPEAVAIFAGATKVGCTYSSSLEGPVHSARQADAFLARGAEAGISPSELRTTVNLTLRLYWAVLDTERGRNPKDWITWDQFRVFCAIQSKLGAKGWGECGWQEIQARAAGWNRKISVESISDAELDSRHHLLLSEKQIRNRVTKLWDTGRFARWSHRGEAWYGLGIQDDELIRRVFAYKEHRKSLHQAKLDQQAEVVARLKGEAQAAQARSKVAGSQEARQA